MNLAVNPGLPLTKNEESILQHLHQLAEPDLGTSKSDLKPICKLYDWSDEYPPFGPKKLSSEAHMRLVGQASAAHQKPL